QSWTMLSNPLRQPKTIYCPRHFDVAEYNVDNRLLVQKHGHCLVRVDGFNDPVSTVPKILRDRHPNQNLVLDEEDRLMNVELFGHAKQRAGPGERSLAHKPLDVLNQPAGIIRLREEAIIVAPVLGRERLAGCQHDFDLGVLCANRASEFGSIHRAGHSDVTKHELYG